VDPTRERAGTLPFALTTCLEQAFDDYEILVSDNNSTDDTRRVVDELGGGRARYIRTGGDLSMRDSWEFALMQAKGEYVTVLPDDGAISSRLLERMDGVVTQRKADLVQSTGGTYFDRSWSEPQQRNTLAVPTFTMLVVEVFLGGDNYALVVIPPDVWNGFKGMSAPHAIIANCCTHPHDPARSIRLDPSTTHIPYDWAVKHQ